MQLLTLPYRAVSSSFVQLIQMVLSSTIADLQVLLPVTSPTVNLIAVSFTPLPHSLSTM